MLLRTAALALSLLAVTAAPVPAATIGDDGLHKEDWFTITFRDIAEDIEAATADGKRLVLVFEQRGCIYCAAMHEKILSDPEVRDFIRENFHVVQYNMFGDEEVTDLDGETLTEKTAARRWGLVFTPTMVFLPEEVPQSGTVADAAVAVMPGAFGKWTFLNMFRWVREKGYAGDEHFQTYHARKLQEARDAGRELSE